MLSGGARRVVAQAPACSFPTPTAAAAPGGKRGAAAVPGEPGWPHSSARRSPPRPPSPAFAAAPPRGPRAPHPPVHAARPWAVPSRGPCNCRAPPPPPRACCPPPPPGPLLQGQPPIPLCMLPVPPGDPIAIPSQVPASLSRDPPMFVRPSPPPGAVPFAQGTPSPSFTPPPRWWPTKRSVGGSFGSYLLHPPKLWLSPMDKEGDTEHWGGGGEGSTGGGVG